MKFKNQRNLKWIAGLAVVVQFGIAATSLLSVDRSTGPEDGYFDPGADLIWQTGSGGIEQSIIVRLLSEPSASHFREPSIDGTITITPDMMDGVRRKKLPGWAQSAMQHDGWPGRKSGIYDQYRRVIGWGWPFVAFTAVVRVDEHGDFVVSKGFAYSTFPKDPWSPSGVVIPGQVRIIGFVLNAIIWSVIIICVSAGMKTGIGYWRRKRVLCVECGYPLSGERCPECGAQTRVPKTPQDPC